MGAAVADPGISSEREIPGIATSRVVSVPPASFTHN